jgi:hypothetical protein
MKNINLAIVFFLMSFMSQAQIVKLSGPRIGGTVVTAGSASDFIQNGIRPGDDGWNNSTAAFISQYGWQLESRFADGEDMVGLIEWVFLVGGMERGLFLPSISSLCGMRSSSGFEAALGPNLSLTGIGMVVALGITIKTPNLNVPVNISFVPGKSNTYETNEYYVWDNETGTNISVPGSSTDYLTGSRISLTVGFNLVN